MVAKGCLQMLPCPSHGLGISLHASSFRKTVAADPRLTARHPSKRPGGIQLIWQSQKVCSERLGLDLKMVGRKLPSDIRRHTWFDVMYWWHLVASNPSTRVFRDDIVHEESYLLHRTKTRRRFAARICLLQVLSCHRCTDGLHETAVEVD